LAQRANQSMKSMDRQAAKLIAIFLADWPVQSQLANCALMLVEAGYRVEIFLAQTWSYVNLERLGQVGGITIYDLPKVGQPVVPTPPIGAPLTFRQRCPRFLRGKVLGLGWLATRMRSAHAVLDIWMQRLLQRVLHRFRMWRNPEGSLLPAGVVPRAVRLMAGKDYRYLIGVEKKGLIWAGQVAERLSVPFLYYNLELYVEDFGRLFRKGSRDFKCLRRVECKYHRRAAGTIIQDPERASVLLRDNGLSFSRSPTYYVPVSVLGGLFQQPSNFLRDTLKLPVDCKLVLYFGQICEDRYCLKVAELAQEFPEDWLLVMHGWPDSPVVLDKIKAVDQRGRVVLSLEMVPAEEIQHLIASADVGLALYDGKIQNDKLTAYSSEKVALYLQCGLPFVAFDFPGYRELAERDRCAATITSLPGLPRAIQTILAAQAEYRAGAYQAFLKHYDYRSNFVQVLAGIDQA
jgi:glycosyltransferase involved in cell wall biosynthesis